MNKTILRNIHLVNWYGFSNRTIPVSENLTLISGENECGKSTILDAIKYAYTGDTQFNKATSGYNTGVGKRNLVSYTRCLVDASAGIYARPADKIPVVYTHIALEYFDQINENPFVLGVVIETAVTDIRGTYWYAMDGKTIADISFVYEENSIIKPYDASGFQKKYGVQMKTKKEGITLFMQMIGLKLPYQEVSKYQRKLRNIMAYNPAAKIQEFIKESVLEEHDVNFDKLKEAKKNIEQINGSLEQINQELKDLDSILADYDEHDKKALQLKIDDIKVKYKDLVQCQRDIREAEELIQKSVIACESIGKKIEEQDREIDDIDKTYSETRRALLALDVSKAIEASKQLMDTYEKQLTKLNDEKEKLDIFQRKVQEMVVQLSELGVTVQNDNVLGRLTSKSLEVAEKQRTIDSLKEEIQGCRDKLIEKNTLLKKELEIVQNDCVEQNNIIESCNKNRMDYSNIQEQVELIKEINRELKRQGINEEAHMAYEYVIELKDENWRNAIEAFLGVHRYAIIVSKDAFDVANAVLDKSRYRFVELVNTKRLMSKKMECEEDSVFHHLAIQNETAANYFKFWLGRIHAVDIEKVPDYDNAMSMEGKLSRNMAVTYIDTRKIRRYCLGSQAIELNRRAAEKKLRELENKEKDILLEQRSLQDKSKYLQAGLECFKEFNLNAHKEWEKVSSDLNDEKGHYKELLEAQKNNVEFMALNERVSVLGRQLETKKKDREENIKQKTVLETTISEKKKSVRGFKVNEMEKQAEIDEERIVSNSAVEKAIEEYDQYISGYNQNSGLMVHATKERIDRRVRELEGNIYGKQQAYNNRKQEVDKLPIGLECEADYQRRRGKIWIDVSVLVYGDSKWFENNNYEEVCTFLRIASGISKEEGERNDAVLSFFYVTPAEQEIFIKGNWSIEWEQYALDTAKLQGGIAIASGDIQSIKSISVNAESVMTIENKTSFQRLKDEKSAMMYLGGFANRYQIEFLKKVVLDNPKAKYQHFGDIDIGGFLIHKQLCRETSKNFELYCMGIQQLCDMRFKHCLRALTDTDLIRLESLIEDSLYSEVLKYMKEHNVKLEQEIVSYYLGQKNSV